jgi:TctA family transporter
MHLDAVFWGSIISVVIAVVVFVFLAFKVMKLMNKDEESHKNQ